MTKEKFLDYTGWLFLIIAILLLRFSERVVDNIVNAREFLLKYSFYGLICSVLFLFLLHRVCPAYYQGGEKRGSAVLSYFFGVIILFVFGMAYYSLKSAKGCPAYIKAVVLDKSVNKRYHTNYLKLLIRGRKERFIPIAREWVKIENGDTLTLKIGNGALGYQHILAFSGDADL